MTDKAFIYLDQSDDGLALMITPLGHVMKLEHELFTEPYDVDDAESPHAQGLITSAQYEAYCKYNQR
jgi:hypothetical protein